MPQPNENFDILGEQSYTYVTTNPTGGGGPVVGPQVPIERIFRSTVSVKTPNFKRLKRRDLPLNEYHYSYKKTLDPTISYSAEFRQQVPPHFTVVFTYVGNCYAVGCDLTGGDYAAVDPTQRAIDQLLERIKLGKANSLVTAAEFRKTASLVASSATRIYKSIRALKSLRFGDLGQALGINSSKVVTSWRKFNSRAQRERWTHQEFQSRKQKWTSDTWLEIQYGWKPLLKDVHDHAQALAHILTQRQNVVRTARGRAFFKGEKTVRLTDPWDVWDRQRTTSSKRWCEFNVKYRLPEGYVHTAGVLGLQNPILVPWELLPFSFVVDWFLPVTKTLEAIAGYYGLVFHEGTKSVRDLATLESMFVGARTISSGGYDVTGFGGGVAKVSWVEIHRYKLLAFPRPAWPDFKDPRSVQHALNAVALLNGLFLTDGAPRKL